MTSEALQKARSFESEYAKFADPERPALHLTPPVGWMNDPNGFSLYKGEYHLFFQYYPYGTTWGPMHWGHAKTRDFIRWEYLPAVMAPDMLYDKAGCFSGSAIELSDGRQLLLYTGVREVLRSDGLMEQLQSQCIAFGDGVDYEKYEGNPVLDISALPEGASAIDFRDPKIWKESDTYYAVMSSRGPDGSGEILLYESTDAMHWTYDGVVDRCGNLYGRMWECPDFFPLDGRQVLMVSPMEMAPMGLEFHAGYGTVALLGTWDAESKTFSREQIHSVDYGIDFYAPQTLVTPDGRRVMIAWMQNWTNTRCMKPGSHIFGCMTIPRELTIRGGRLIQNPVRELERYRRNRVRYQDLVVDRPCHFSGVSGRAIDLTVEVRPSGNEIYQQFHLEFAMDGVHRAQITYQPNSSILTIDRSRSGGRFDIVHEREFRVTPRQGQLKLRLILDRNCVELFVNDGEQAATLLLYGPEEAEAICFSAQGSVVLNVDKYDLTM